MGWAALSSLLYLQALKKNMSKKTRGLEELDASNVASSSPMNKRIKDRNDLAMKATPSDEVMNALFEQVAVSPGGERKLIFTESHVIERSEHVE